MKANTLKEDLWQAAKNYADKKNFPIDESHKSTIIFKSLKDNFHPDSYKNIIKNPKWEERTLKSHQNVTGVKEMQSSNSSDALLMNIFCHPDIGQWKGVRNLIGGQLDTINFGIPGNVHINGGQIDKTEIDMELTGLFCEAKLTESDFTKKEKDIVERYDNLNDIFHKEELHRIGENYCNYQIIRNLLAAFQYGKKHMLLCDERRPDLVRKYMQTVTCLKAIHNRKKCRVVFWQEIVDACGATLRDWIAEKYGM